MKSRERIIRLAAALGVFLLAFGALMFYLQYEGVTTYEYLFAEQPDMVLTPADADQMSISPESAYATAYARNQQMVFNLERQPIGAVRVHYANQTGPHVTARLSYTLSDSGETYSMVETNRRGRQEVIFSIPQHEYDQIDIQVNDLCGVERIEVYAQTYYADATKHVPRLFNIGIALLLAALLTGVFLCSDTDIRTGKGLGFPALYLMLEISVLRFCLQTRSYDAYRQEFEIALYVLLVVFTLIMCAAYRMLFIKKAPLHQVFALCGITMGLLMMVLIQPFGVPDEGTHYREAYMRSNDLLGKSSQKEHEIRKEDLRFYERMLELGVETRNEKYMILADEFSLFAKLDEDGLFVRDGRIKSVPLGYVFSGTGITIARLLDLSGVMQFYLGRFSNLLMYVALMTLAIYWLPFGKAAAMVVALAPVAMQQAASYSYDAVVTALSFLFVSYALKLYAQKETISLRQYVICIALAVLLGPSKAVYAPLSMAVLLIPAKKYGFGKQKWIWNLLAVAAAFAALFVMQMGTMANIAGAGTASQEASARGYALSYILGNIREIISMYLRTFEVYSDFYFEYLFSQYLAWHEFSAYNWLTALSCVLFVLGSQRCREETALTVTPWKRWGAIVVFIGIVMITQLTLLMDWTPMGFEYIEGVQGRYFIPAMIVLIPTLRNDQMVVSAHAHRWIALLAIWSSLFAAVNLLQVMPK